MKINIGNKVKTPTDSYVVEIETMYGDADGWGKVIVGDFKIGEEEYLEDLLKTCERMDEAYPHGRGCWDNYNHVEGFNKWFSIDDTTDEEYSSMSDRMKELTSDWEFDPQSDGSHASYHGYNVFYYDGNGVKHSVYIEM